MTGENGDLEFSRKGTGTADMIDMLVTDQHGMNAGRIDAAPLHAEQGLAQRHAHIDQHTGIAGLQIETVSLAAAGQRTDFHSDSSILGLQKLMPRRARKQAGLQMVMFTRNGVWAAYSEAF